MARTIYILGAGFSASCEIATDREMLDELNNFLDNTPPAKSSGERKTSIDYLRDQLFHNQQDYGFETFMSVLNGQSFLAKCLDPDNKIFEEEEEKIILALRKYLTNKVDAAVSKGQHNPVCTFIDRVNWEIDVVITFNYDLLLERFLEQKRITPRNKILHLHGSLNDSMLVYPNYNKFASESHQMFFQDRWRDAYNILRQKEGSAAVAEWQFIGYSMPPTDSQARGLFAYVDHDNQGSKHQYKISVVNPDHDIQKNYSFLRKKIIFHELKLETYLGQ